MANMAIRVAGCKPVEAVRVLFGALVFVIVVPDVHAGRAFLMRAIWRGCSPDRLQGQQNEQEDGEPAGHKGAIIEAYVLPPMAPGNLRLNAV